MKIPIIRKIKNVLFGDNSNKIRTFAIISVSNTLQWKNSTSEQLKQKYIKWLENPSKHNKKQILNAKEDFLISQVQRKGNKYLKKSNFSYTELKGSYWGEKEKFLIIFNITYKDAETTARNYGQESFFFVESHISNNITYNDIYYYMTFNYYKTYKLVDELYDIKLINRTSFFSKHGFSFLGDIPTEWRNKNNS